MKTVYTMMLLTLIALGLACGYSSKSTPPTAGAMPAISSLSPNSATAGSMAFTMTVNGTNFAAQAVVNWNGAAQSTTHISSNQLTVMIPASAIATSGSAQVTVTNPGTSGGAYGGGTLPETSSPMTFTIN